MNEHWSTTALIIGVGFALSFLFSGIEAGVFALSRLRIRQLRRNGNRQAAILQGYLDHPEDFLWTVLVGNTVANFAVLGVVALILLEKFSGRPGWGALVFVGVTYLFYALAELLPKILFRTFPNRLCLAMAIPFRLVHGVFSPVVMILEWMSRKLLRWSNAQPFTGHVFGTREELRFVMEESAGQLSNEERAMINRVLDLQNRSIGQVMTPLSAAVTLSTTDTIADAIRLAKERQLTRFPVRAAGEGERRVFGILTLRGVLYQEGVDPGRPVTDFVQPAVFLPETTSLEDAFRRLQRAGQRLAIVTGRDQREIGIVTLEDVLKSVFGQVKL